MKIKVQPKPKIDKIALLIYNHFCGMKFILCFLALLMSVHYCTFNQDNGVFEEYTSDDVTPYNTGLPRLELTTPSPVTSKENWMPGASLVLYDKDGNLIS